MSDSEKVYIGKQANDMGSSPQYDGYTRVELTVSDSEKYVSGPDTGRTLEVKNPFGSQKMCDDILGRIKGFAYQPVSASNAHVNPAAEIGDGVTVGDTYSGIYSQVTRFGTELTADIAAPTDRDVDHEYSFKPKKDRETSRRFAANELAISTNSAGIMSLGNQLNALESEYGEAYESLVAEIGGVSASLEEYASHQKDMDEAIAKLSSRIGDTESALVLYANRTAETESAISSLSSRVGNAEASLTLKASRNSVAALERSIAVLKADYVRIQSSITNVNDALIVFKNGENKGISVSGNIIADHDITAYGKLRGQSLYINGSYYSPRSITSIYGNVYALGS